MLDLLMILPYSHEGRSIDWGTDLVLALNDRDELPRHATSRMAQGTAQAIAALEADRFRAILLVEYQRWGTGTAEVWSLVESARLFDKTLVRWATSGPHSGGVNSLSWYLSEAPRWPSAMSNISSDRHLL